MLLNLFILSILYNVVLSFWLSNLLKSGINTDGLLYDFWGAKVDKMIENNNKFAYPLGACAFCYGFWFSVLANIILTIFIILFNIYVYNIFIFVIIQFFISGAINPFLVTKIFREIQ